MSMLWPDATCRVEESGDVSPHSKVENAELPEARGKFILTG